MELLKITLSHWRHEVTQLATPSICNANCPFLVGSYKKYPRMWKCRVLWVKIIAHCLYNRSGQYNPLSTLWMTDLLSLAVSTSPIINWFLHLSIFIVGKKWKYLSWNSIIRVTSFLGNLGQSSNIWLSFKGKNDEAIKVLYPKYSKHWPYFLVSIMDSGCSKI